jgi:hypothetical protein
VGAARGRRSIAVAGLVGLALAGAVHAEPLLDRAGILPQGTDFGEPALELPRQVLSAERLGGEQSFLIGLGNLLFSSPSILGEPARSAGMSCNTCHVGGDGNPAFFLPGHSSRPGTVDVTGPAFNPRTDDRLFNPLAIPSLRGIRQTAPYGRDGRMASLREFTRHVVVQEFAGAEPDPLLLDALVAYMQQIEFLPNAKLGPAGLLTGAASEAARRGEKLFFAPSPRWAPGAAPRATCRAQGSSMAGSTTSAPAAPTTRRPCATWRSGSRISTMVGRPTCRRWSRISTRRSSSA